MADAQTALAQLLIDKVREDTYPSSTHMTILEQTLPPDLRDEYMEVLLQKVVADRHPSISMLRRIQRLAGAA